MPSVKHFEGEQTECVLDEEDKPPPLTSSSKIGKTSEDQCRQARAIQKTMNLLGDDNSHDFSEPPSPSLVHVCWNIVAFAKKALSELTNSSRGVFLEVHRWALSEKRVDFAPLSTSRIEETTTGHEDIQTVSCLGEVKNIEDHARNLAKRLSPVIGKTSGRGLCGNAHFRGTTHVVRHCHLVIVVPVTLLVILSLRCLTW